MFIFISYECTFLLFPLVFTTLTSEFTAGNWNDGEILFFFFFYGALKQSNVVSSPKSFQRCLILDSDSGIHSTAQKAKLKSPSAVILHEKKAERGIKTCSDVKPPSVWSPSVFVFAEIQNVWSWTRRSPLLSLSLSPSVCVSLCPCLCLCCTLGASGGRC